MKITPEMIAKAQAVVPSLTAGAVKAMLEAATAGQVFSAEDVAKTVVANCYYVHFRTQEKNGGSADHFRDITVYGCMEYGSDIAGLSRACANLVGVESAAIVSWTQLLGHIRPEE